jgi:hypothetical protein
VARHLWDNLKERLAKKKIPLKIMTKLEDLTVIDIACHYYTSLSQGIFVFMKNYYLITLKRQILTCVLYSTVSRNTVSLKLETITWGGPG